MSLLQGARDVTSADPPLHCNVCPKKPDFSDVSHLLTHVASKGHLSSVYKLRVQASGDPTVKRAIDRYDDWYADYNLDDLMAERLRQKESKRTSGGTGSRRAGTASGSTRSTPVATNGVRRSNKLRDNMHLLDPQLNRGMRYNTAPTSRSATPASMFNGFDPAHFGRFAAPPLQNWAVNSMSNSPLSTHIKQESIDSEDFDDEDYDDDESFELPVARPTRRRRQVGSGSVNSYDVDEEEEPELLNEGDKLKGVKWPGMDMFDSATFNMRRKRNQKKNASVLRQLQATSEIIEPTECVFDQAGTLRKEREITGNPPESEDDLIEGESEPEVTAAEKKRVRRQPRLALAEKPVNNRQLRTRNQTRTLPSRRRDSVMVDALMDEDDVKRDMTYGRPPPKKRTGLSIHRDNSGPDITFDQPAALNYLTASFNGPFHHGNQNQFQDQHGFNLNGVPRSHARQPSWSQFQVSFRPSSNGNGISNVSQGGFGHLFSHPSLTGSGVPGTPSTAHAQPSFRATFGMGSGSHSLPNQVNPLFQGHVNNHSWDMFNLDHDSTAGFLGGAEPGFGFHGDGAVNDVKDGTLVESSMWVSEARDDDEATISAPSDK